MDQFPLAWRFTDERWDRGAAALRCGPAPAARRHAPASCAPRLAAACALYHHGEGRRTSTSRRHARRRPTSMRTRAGARRACPRPTTSASSCRGIAALALETSWRTFTSAVGGLLLSRARTTSRSARSTSAGCSATTTGKRSRSRRVRRADGLTRRRLLQRLRPQDAGAFANDDELIGLHAGDLLGRSRSASGCVRSADVAAPRPKCRRRSLTE